MWDASKEARMEPQKRPRRGGYGKDPFPLISVGLFLVWTGVLWFLRAESILTMGEWWQWFLVGVGIILILERLIRYLLPVYRRPVLGRIFLGMTLIAIGTSFMLGVNAWWPLVVAILGVAIIVYAIHRSRRSML
jgi:hypothetical protein